jgi:hypothetical protein
MKKRFKIPIIIIIVLVLLFIILDALTRIIIYPKVSHSAMDNIINDPNNENHNPLNYSDLDFVMNDSYIIHGTMVLNKSKSNKFVIYTHGWGNNRLSGLKYMDPYLEEGYNFYMYDLRGSGENSDFLVSMGENESFDLLQIIKALRERYDNDINISLHGESLGAFSSLLVLNDSPLIKSCVVDSAYTSIEDVLKTNMRERNIPVILYYPIQLFAKLRYNLNFSRYNALESVNHSNTPLLIINGIDDTTVIKEMAKDLYDSSISINKKLYYFEGAEHIQSQQSNPERYKKIVIRFIQSIK